MRTKDGDIIRRCLDGEPEAFGFLVDKYKSSIYAFAYTKLGNFHDAEDVTQEVFLKAYRNLRKLRRWDSFFAWIYSITSNLCKYWIIEQAKRPDCESIHDHLPEVMDNRSVKSHQENELYETLHEALYSLPDMYRQVLVLYYFGDMNSFEIASFLGASPTTIRKRLSRARSQLREEMIAMMDQVFEPQKLQASFTFHIVEAVKHISIRPLPHIDKFPWGISLAAGIIIALLSLGSHTDVSSPIAISTNYQSPNQVEMKEVMEIPVDVLDAIYAQSRYINQGVRNPDGNGVSNGNNVSLLAPGGQADGFPEEPSERIGKGDIIRLAFSPDGKLLAAAGMIGVWLYDAEDLHEVGFLEGHTVRLSDIAFSPDGEMLASAAWDGTVRLWDVKDQKEIGLLNLGAEPVAIAISLDGEMLAVGAFEAIQLWDIEQQKRLATLRGQTSYAQSLAFSPDGKILASDSNTISELKCDIKYCILL